MEMIVPQSISQEDWKEIVDTLGRFAYHHQLEMQKYEKVTSSYDYHKHQTDKAKRLMILK